ncbi:MAG: recombinase RecA [Patescibacteria group bacterium]
MAKQTKEQTDVQKTGKQQAIGMALESIQKQYGKGAIMKMGDRPQIAVDGISTGVMPLDTALGGRGVPKGRIVEVYGPEGSGKTTLCLSLIAEAQKAGGAAAFIDAEHALDPDWANILGVNIEELLISQPDNGEQALEIAETLVRSGAIDIMVIDSVAALVPRAEIEGDMGDPQMGLHARLMSQALRKLTGLVSKSKTVIVFTNQIRLKIGVMFGNPETTTGGMALKFYASVRMDVRKIETIKKNNEVIGTRVRVKIVKNKIAPPFREAEFVINSGGIDRDEALLEAAIREGVLTRSGSFIKLGDNVLGQGRDQVKELFAQDPKLRADILKNVRQKAVPPSKPAADQVAQKTE